MAQTGAGQGNGGRSGNDYAIGAVSRLTGISTHTLRIWERRYGAVVAERTESGRRIYSRRDVEKLGLLKILVDRGFSIGQIANLDLEELRARREEVVRQANDLQLARSDEPIRVAALGRFALQGLGRSGVLPEQVELAALESDPRRFRADIRRLRPDVLLIEVPVVDERTAERIAGLRDLCGAGRVMVLYNFGRSDDVNRLAAAQFELFRAPTTALTLVEALLRGPRVTNTAPQPARSEQQRAAGGALSVPVLTEELPPRRFDDGQLATLAGIRTDVDCECPHHLADLVQSLTAFEVYSDQCESRSNEDAALHAYLHAMTARARALMEESLATLARVEKLEY
ncbi:MAG TPA: MerR family transcriptional regulator [Woeseiaceae bacterium]|nr:MerR family transcriptional regulator [Woeseiaceae bacterium]